MIPKISIIVPVYNTEKYICRCIDSILAQTFSDLECILIDDGSSDNCPAICDDYAKKDNRIIVIHQENKGASAARNAGLDKAQGEWIGFVDSDDWCDPEMFGFLYENAIKHDADVSMCGVRKMIPYEKCINIKLGIFNGEEAILKMFTPGYFDGFSPNKLVKSKLIFQHNLRYDETIKYMEDILFFYKLFKNDLKIVYSSEQYYNYYAHHESVTSQYGFTDEARTAEIMFDRLISEEKNKKIKKKIIQKKILFSSKKCRDYIMENDYNNNYLYLKKDIKQNLNYLVFDFAVPVKYKMFCCLVLVPWLFKPVFSIFVYIKNRSII